MPRIGLPEDLPGIVSLFSFKPATAVKLREIYQELLRGPGPLSFVDRERIAAHASKVDRCEYCFRSHEAVVRALESGAGDSSPVTDPEDPKLAALLRLAGAVALGGDQVTDEHVESARRLGASDEEIHDTVLIAAAFCMAGRYVNALAATTPDDDAVYDAIGVHLATNGYLASSTTQ